MSEHHQGISLLKIAGKIFACILLNRLRNHLEEDLLSESQYDFRHYRGTADMIFVARQPQEKYQEMRIHLYSTFVDLTKAIGAVSREGLGRIMQKFGCPERVTQMVRRLHDGMTARVTANGVVSEAFSMTNGVKQGCILALTLLGLIFYALLLDVYRNELSGIRVAYRMDGRLLNQWRMHFQSRVSATSVHELLFTDNFAFNATSEGDMQRSMDLFVAACDNFGLIISTEKTVIKHKPPPDAVYVASQISMEGAQQQAVDDFTYIDSTLSCHTKIDDEMARRTSKAS
nr:unnamed protein product [Spirometra erinaceieuropaei]